MTSYPRLEKAAVLDGYRLILTFEGAEQRIYDFTPNLEHKYYAQLMNAKLFEKLSVVDGELIWATGQDFCPHTLYEQSVVSR